MFLIFPTLFICLKKFAQNFITRTSRTIYVTTETKFRAVVVVVYLVSLVMHGLMVEFKLNFMFSYCPFSVILPVHHSARG